MSFFKKGKRPSFAPPVQPQQPAPSIAPQKALVDARSEFEIPSALLTASLIAKSELTGKELTQFAFNMQRFFVETMKRSADENGAPQS